MSNSSSTNRRRQRKAKQKETETNTILRGMTRWRPLIEVAGILVALMLLIVTSLQLREMRATRQLENRAWVSVKDAKIDDPGAGQHLRAFIRYKNSGKTPALNVLAHYTISLRDRSGKTTVKADYSYPVGATIGPDAEAMIFRQTDTPLQQDAVNQLNHGHISFFIEGKLTYKDIFEQLHSTIFCFTYRPPSLALMDCGGISN